MSDNCPICLEGLHQDLGVAVPCGHVFHAPCFAFLKKSICAECHDDPPQTKIVIPCPVCKRTVKKFRKLYLTYQSPEEESLSTTSENKKNKSEKVVIQLTRDNIRLQKRLRELKTLSNDQSDLLFRILPRYDHMESRHDKLKRDKRELQKALQLQSKKHAELVENHHTTEELLAEAQESQQDLHVQLQETNAENKDLHDIWNTLEQQLGNSYEKRKHTKHKLKTQKKERDLELEMMKSQMARLKQQKKCLKVALRHSQEQALDMQTKLRNKKQQQQKNHRYQNQKSKKQHHTKTEKDDLHDWRAKVMKGMKEQQQQQQQQQRQQITNKRFVAHADEMEIIC